MTEHRSSWEHIPVLDGIRGLAALLVIVHHFFKKISVPTGGVTKVLYRLTDLGIGGVDLFFVLSGFLITGILLTVKGTPGAWPHFYMRRVLRIFPLYYGFLLVATVVSLAMGRKPHDLSDTWWLWTYLQNIKFTFFFDWSNFGFNFETTHFWSLAVEEHFYLIWPVIVLALSKRNMIRFLYGIIGLAFISRLVLQYFNVDTYFFTLCRMDALALGGLIAFYWSQEGRVTQLVRAAKLFFLFTLIVSIPLYAGCSGKGFAIIQPVKYQIVAIAYGSFMVLVLTSWARSLVGRFFSLRFMRNLGKYSYAIYIFHPLTIDFFFLEYNKRFKQVEFTSLLMPLVFIINVFIVYFLAYLSWHLYERHFLDLKKYFQHEPGLTSGKNVI